MKLPNIYKGKVNEDNNLRMAYASKEENIDVKDIINKLFKQNKLYKQDVYIETKDKTYNTKIIGRTNEHIITINNEVIKIDEIIKIKTS